MSVIQEAYVHGVSTKKVDELVQALGLEGVSKSEVSRICKELDDEVERFRTRQLGAFPYLWLDATYRKVREDGRGQSMALVVATGVRDTGEREVLGLDVGPSEDGAFWLAFLRGLVARGLKGVKRVISDAHEGLRAAIEAVLQGASWQRCRVHVLRNALAQVPKSAQPMVAAAVRTIFTQPSQDEARAQLRHVAQTLGARFPKAAQLLCRLGRQIGNHGGEFPPHAGTQPRIVGWAVGDHLKAELVVDALNMAVVRRRPGKGLIHHSDHGAQYTSLVFGTTLRKAGIAGSMGRVGDALDYAAMEGFWATLQAELLDRKRWRTRQEL